MSTKPLIGILGAAGRMGQALLAEAPLGLVAISRQKPAVLGADQQWVREFKDAPALSVLIDFTSAEQALTTLAWCVAEHVPLVLGTTGLPAAFHQAWLKAGQQIPCLYASNFSLGVAALRKILPQLSKLLPAATITMTETHHQHKRDAPSGTALTLQAALDRPLPELPIESIRAGEEVGEHSLVFKHKYETLTIRHQAHDRALFAQGALQAAQWLMQQRPGCYDLMDVLSTPVIGSLS